MPILNLISPVRLASFGIKLSQYLKYSAFSRCFSSNILCTRDNCLKILITLDIFHIHFHFMTPYKFNYSTIMASRTVSFLAGSTRSSAYKTVQITCLPTDRTSILSNKNEIQVCESSFYGPKGFKNIVYISHPLYFFSTVLITCLQILLLVPRSSNNTPHSLTPPHYGPAVVLQSVYLPFTGLQCQQHSTSTTLLFMGPQYQQAVLQSAHSLNKTL